MSAPDRETVRAVIDYVTNGTRITTADKKVLIAAAESWLALGEGQHVWWCEAHNAQGPFLEVTTYHTAIEVEVPSWEPDECWKAMHLVDAPSGACRIVSRWLINPSEATP